MATTPRLPTPGGDDGSWGDLLNAFLLVEHNPDGSLIRGTDIDTALYDADAKKLQGTLIDSSTPSDGQTLVYNAAASVWAPATVTSSGTVSDATTGSKGVVQLAGDLGGTASAPTISKIHTGATQVTLPASAPSSGQVLTATSGTATAWQTPASAPVASVAGKTGVVTLANTDISGLGGAATLNVGTTTGTVAAGNDSRITGALQPGVTAGGDLSGTLPNPSVAKVNGIAVSGTPSANQVLTASSSTAASWQTPASAPVASVAGKTGVVTLSTSDISGLGGAATLNVGSSVGTVAAGNDSRITGALQSGATAGGDLSGTLPSPTVAKVNGIAVTGTPSANQVLTASSSTAASWQTPASGFADPLTTKGDVLVHGSSTTRLPVGTNGQVLTADSSQSLGIKWASPAAGGGGTFTATARSTAYTASSYDFVLANAASAGFTVTLPPASNGAVVRIKKLDATTNAIIVAGQSASTIDGSASQVLNSQFQSQDYMSDGTNWYQV